MRNGLVVDGFNFYKSKQGYWIGSIGVNKLKRLHIYVWEKEHGKIPKGYSIHHVDFDKDNNDLSNLAIMDSSEHKKYHASFFDKEKARENMINIVIPAAREWHGTEEGLNWHRDHYNKMKDKLHINVEVTCIQCGKTVTRGFGGCGNKFCSDKCKERYRTEKKVGWVTIKCEYCGKEHSAAKSNHVRYCSKACATKGTHENKRNKKNR